MHSIFNELTLLLILAGAIAFIVSLLKQPSIVGYIITGLLLGPLGYYKIREGEALSGLAEIGITLLLFMVGLELDMSQLKKMGRSVLFAGLTQVLLTSSAGFLLLKLLHFSTISSLYLAAALTFSSTIIVVKLLSEKKDLQSLYGKLAVGIFLVQDFFAILILIGLSSLGGHEGGMYASLPLWQNIILAMVRGLILVLGVMWVSTKVFPKVLKVIGGNDELLLVFSLAWALGLAAFVATPLIGFSLEIGGFLAGLSLASSSVHFEVSARIKPIRDFFIVIFFIILGSGLVFTGLGSLTLPVILLCLFVLIGKPLIVLISLACLGFKPRTGFLAGVTVAQVSEFSLILAGIGSKLGHLQSSDVALITITGIVSISMSSYMIMYASRLADSMRGLLSWFDFKKGSAEKYLSTVVLKNHVILVGAHRLGHHLLDSLQKQKTPFIVVDFNPEIVEQCIERGLLSVCGDITDPYIQEQVNLHDAKVVISTVPDHNDNLALVAAIQKTFAGRRAKPRLIFVAQNEEDVRSLYDKGIDYVVSPHVLGGQHLAQVLKGKTLHLELRKLREHHLKHMPI